MLRPLEGFLRHSVREWWVQFDGANAILVVSIGHFSEVGDDLVEVQGQASVLERYKTLVVRPGYHG